jgi:hypothetical protein
VGRDPKDFESARIDALTKAFADKQYRFKELVVSIVRDDAFRMRRGGS